MTAICHWIWCSLSIAFGFDIFGFNALMRCNWIRMRGMYQRYISFRHFITLTYRLLVATALLMMKLFTRDDKLPLVCYFHHFCFVSVSVRPGFFFFSRNSFLNLIRPFAFYMYLFVWVSVRACLFHSLLEHNKKCQVSLDTNCFIRIHARNKNRTWKKRKGVTSVSVSSTLLWILSWTVW